MRILYQFPLSHYCEKVRWILDYKELDYVAHNLTLGLHRSFIKKRIGTQHTTVPLLNDQNTWLNDSTKIAMYLDDKYPERKIIRSHYAMKSKIFNINELASELGHEVRRLTLAHIILKDSELFDIMIGNHLYVKKFERYARPMIESLLFKKYDLSPDRLKIAEHRISQIVEQLNEYIDKRTHIYLVGDRLSLADISICSMLAPLLNIQGTPWEQEAHYRMPDIQILENSIKNSELGTYITHLYEHDRNARVDWRGI